MLHNANALANPNNWLSREKFKLYKAHDIMTAPEQIKNGVGVYVILLRRADQLMERAGLPNSSALLRWNLDGYQHVYTGQSVALRWRVLHHLCATVRDSAVRENLLALQFSHSILWPHSKLSLQIWENELSDWMAHNALVGVHVTDQPHVLEKKLIERLPSPFNSEFNSRDTVLAELAQRRQEFRRQLEQAGQGYERTEQVGSYWLKEAMRHLTGWQSRRSTKPSL